MNHGTTCKFCKKPITIEIDDDYTSLGDRFKIFVLATCNRCADLRVERRNIECKVKITAMMLVVAGNHRTPELDSKCRNVFEDLLKKYANLIARWHYLSGMSWDDEAVRLAMDKPEHWSKVLAMLWKIFADANKNRKAIES